MRVRDNLSVKMKVNVWTKFSRDSRSMRKKNKKYRVVQDQSIMHELKSIAVSYVFSRSFQKTNNLYLNAFFRLCLIHE